MPEKNFLPGTVDALVAKAQALVDAVSFDDNGAIVAGQYVGGNGGLLSRDTLKVADALRIELAVWRESIRRSPVDHHHKSPGEAEKSATESTSSSPPNSGGADG